MHTRTTRCDVLVVGGGPAGSTCAAELARAGLDVVVIDRSDFPRDKTCAGWITPQVVSTIGLDLEDYARGRVLQPISGFVTGVIGAEPSRIRYGDTVSYGIRRCEFDHYLLERSGARLRLGERVEQIERQGAGWRINGDIESAMLVGAGGHFCPVASYLGARVGRTEPVIAAQEAEFLADSGSCLALPEEPELYFCRSLSGYGWCFRKGDFLNVGLGRIGHHGLGGAVREFWDWLAARSRVPAGPMPRMKGHAYLLHGFGARRRIDDAIALVGDAAGLAYPQSGEGIRPAVESGVLLARVIAAAAGDYSRVRLQVYVAELERRLGEPGTPPRSADSFSSRVRALLGRNVIAHPWFARRIVLDRWFLHAHESPLQSLASPGAASGQPSIHTPLRA